MIVDDGSTDRTGDILDRYAAQYPWIRVIHRTNRGFRKSGGGVMEAFYDGYNALQCKDWDFIVKLDGDLSFPPEYFEKCFEYFDTDSELGIGGGEIHHDVSGTMKVEENPRFHVRGATKIYSKPCWEAIGGLWPAPGWDTIDEVKASMLGWKTYAFSDLNLLHHRFTGSEEGLLRDQGEARNGMLCFRLSPSIRRGQLLTPVHSETLRHRFGRNDVWISEGSFHSPPAFRRSVLCRIYTPSATEASLWDADDLEVISSLEP